MSRTISVNACIAAWLCVAGCSIAAASGVQVPTDAPELADAATQDAQRTGLLTLDEAIRRAQANEPAFRVAAAQAQALTLARKDARAALLPSADFRGQALYTEPNGVPASRIGQTANAPSPIFIANNAVREYASQAVFSETVGLGQIGAIKLADASAARAQAQLEIARRGLVTTVVTDYYAVDAGMSKQAIAEEALAQASSFLEVTQKREAQREAAHADVLKAELQQQQRQRELQEVRLTSARARIELGVLLFPDPSTRFELPSDAPPPALPDRAATEAAARQNNPELSAAFAAVQVNTAEIYTARAALVPQLTTNFIYGIDATNFGINGPDGIHNLGYSFGATLDVPLWDWLTTERKIKEARILGQGAKSELTAAQRRLLANFTEFYAEASTAQSELASLDLTVTDAQESLRLTSLRYVDGESTVLEVVDAQSTLNAAEMARVDGLVRYRVALAGLQTLTGTL